MEETTATAALCVFERAERSLFSGDEWDAIAHCLELREIEEHLVEFGITSHDAAIAEFQIVADMRADLQRWHDAEAAAGG